MKLHNVVLVNYFLSSQNTHVINQANTTPMHTIKDYFEEASHKAGNDSALARQLGIIQQATSNYRTGRRVPNTQVARRLAQYLNVREPLVVIAAEAARATDKETKQFWETLGKKVATTAALLVTTGGLASPLLQAYGKIDAEMLRKTVPANDPFINYTQLLLLIFTWAAAGESHHAFTGLRGALRAKPRYRFTSTRLRAS